MAFDKVILRTGEARKDFIQQRLKEGAAPEQVLKEINSPEIYSGAEGKSWPMSVVATEQRKLAPKRNGSDEIATPAALPSHQGAEALVNAGVPEQFEGLLDETDMAEVRQEAAQRLHAKKHKQAREEALKLATAELEREAAVAAQSGSPKGDMVDIHINLAPAVMVGKAKISEHPCIKLDGRAYYANRVYRVPRKVANMLEEQIFRSWQHEGSLKGNNENAYRSPRMASINMRTGDVQNAPQPIHA